MAEIVSVAALVVSVVNLAGEGLKVSQTINDFVDRVRIADYDIRRIAENCKSMSIVLKQLGDCLESEEHDQTANGKLLGIIMQSVDDCNVLFEDMGEMIKDSVGATPEADDQDIVMRRREKFKWAFNSTKIARLQSNLDWLKTDLDLKLGILRYAQNERDRRINQQVSAEERAAQQRMRDLDIAMQRLKVQKLEVQREHAARVYEIQEASRFLPGSRCQPEAVSLKDSNSQRAPPKNRAAEAVNLSESGEDHTTVGIGPRIDSGVCTDLAEDPETNIRQPHSRLEGSREPATRDPAPVVTLQQPIEITTSATTEGNVMVPEVADKGFLHDSSHLLSTVPQVQQLLARGAESQELKAQQPAEEHFRRTEQGIIKYRAPSVVIGPTIANSDNDTGRNGTQLLPGENSEIFPTNQLGGIDGNQNSQSNSASGSPHVSLTETPKGASQGRGANGISSLPPSNSQAEDEGPPKNPSEGNPQPNDTSSVRLASEDPGGGITSANTPSPLAAQRSLKEGYVGDDTLPRARPEQGPFSGSTVPGILSHGIQLIGDPTQTNAMTPTEVLQSTIVLEQAPAPDRLSSGQDASLRTLSTTAGTGPRRISGRDSESEASTVEKSGDTQSASSVATSVKSESRNTKMTLSSRLNPKKLKSLFDRRVSADEHYNVPSGNRTPPRPAADSVSDAESFKGTLLGKKPRADSQPQSNPQEAQVHPSTQEDGSRAYKQVIGDPRTSASKIVEYQLGVQHASPPRPPSASTTRAAPPPPLPTISVRHRPPPISRFPRARPPDVYDLRLVHQPSGRPAHAGGVLPILEGWLLARAAPGDGIPERSWIRITRVLLPITFEELDTVVKNHEKQGSAFWEEFSALSNYQQRQIDRLLEDKRTDDPDQRHEWILKALKIEPQGARRTKVISLQIVLKRRLRIGALSLSVTNPQSTVPPPAIKKARFSGALESDGDIEQEPRPLKPQPAAPEPDATKALEVQAEKTRPAMSLGGDGETSPQFQQGPEQNKSNKPNAKDHHLPGPLLSWISGQPKPQKVSAKPELEKVRANSRTEAWVDSVGSSPVPESELDPEVRVPPLRHQAPSSRHSDLTEEIPRSIFGRPQAPRNDFGVPAGVLDNQELQERYEEIQKQDADVKEEMRRRSKWPRSNTPQYPHSVYGQEGFASPTGYGVQQENGFMPGHSVIRQQPSMSADSGRHTIAKGKSSTLDIYGGTASSSPNQSRPKMPSFENSATSLEVNMGGESSKQSTFGTASMVPGLYYDERLGDQLSRPPNQDPTMDSILSRWTILDPTPPDVSARQIVRRGQRLPPLPRAMTDHVHQSIENEQDDEAH